METRLAVKVKSVVAVMKVKIFSKTGSRVFTVDDIDFPSMIYFKVPVYFDFDNYLHEYEDSINTIIARNIEAMTGEIKRRAKKAKVMVPDGVEFTLMNIYSEKEAKKEGIAQWKTVEE